MKRTNIYLTEQQISKLARLTKLTGIKSSELIRRILDDGIARMEKTTHA